MNREGRMGDGGGQADQAASGVTSVTSLLTMIGDGEEENAAGVGLEQFSFKMAHNILELEGANEDAEGDDAAVLDDLLILAGDGEPKWVEELRRYLQEEEREREQMQKERAVRLALWRESVTVEPT